jgi:transcription elongation factor Elf1
MKPIKLTCPYCGTEFTEKVESLAEFTGHVAICDNCEKEFYYQFSFELKLEKIEKSENP